MRAEERNYTRRHTSRLRQAWAMLARGGVPAPAAASARLEKPASAEAAAVPAEGTPVEALTHVRAQAGLVDIASRELTASFTMRLRRQASATETSVGALCHLAWAQVLRRVSGRDDVVFGTVCLSPSRKRPEREARGRVAAVRFRTEHASLVDAVRECHALLAGLSGRASALAPRDEAQPASAAGLITSVLEYCPERSAGRPDGEGNGPTSEVVANGSASQYPLVLVVKERLDTLHLVARVGLPASAERVCDLMASALEALVGGLERAPGAGLQALDVLPPAERQRLVVEWNRTHAEYPKHRCVHDLFHEQAVARPEAVAVAHGDHAWTYAELNARANRLAQHLRGLGIGPEVRVATLLPRSFELVVAELAVLKCGAAYVPLDENAPAERLAFLIEDSDAALVLTMTDAELPERVRARSLRLDALRLDAGEAGATELPLSSEATAYLMYTSGSTGQPKGVEIPHRAMGRLLLNSDHAQLESTDRVAFLANPAFDPSTLEVWGPLLHGACIVIVDAATVLAPERLCEVLLRQRVTVLNLTSGVFNQYSEALSGSFPQLRYLLVGGDVVDPRVVSRVLRNNPPTHLLNTYGPTETTLYATACEIREVPEGAGALPIGRPIANTTVYVLDESGRPVPIGVTGELHVGGDGVARGYTRRPALTAERFVPDRFGGEPGARLYKTGDLARWNANGQLEFAGRNDLQVKLRGFRVELGEIEARLAEFPGIGEVAVVAREDEPGDKRLVAYFSRGAGVAAESVNAENLRQHLSLVLPEYMVPAAYVVMGQLPLTPNGKVDRKALPAPAGEAYVTRPYEAPQGELEQTLARLWAELLDVEGVGRHDDFFELGGDSIRAIKLIWKIRAEGFELQPSQVVENPTLAELAACLGGAINSGGEQGVLEGEVPLTVAQRKFFASNPSEPNHHNQAHVFELTARWGIESVREVFAVLEAQHDILRARFTRTCAEWRQTYHALSEQLPVEAIDARSVAEPDAAEWLHDAASDVQRSLDIEAGPLYQARLIHFSERDVLLIVIHHLVIDGVSWRIIADDLNRLFAQARAGQPRGLSPKGWSFREWATGIIAYAEKPQLSDELREHWGPLGSVEACPAPPGLWACDAETNRVVCRLSKEETAQLLTEAPRALNTQVNDLLLTALGLALKATFGPDRWRIQLEGHGREQGLVPGSDVSKTVGWFTSEFPFVIDAAGDSLPNIISKVKRDLRAVPNKGVGYGLLCHLRTGISAADRALLDALGSKISFNYLGQTGRDLEHDEVRASALPSGAAISASNRSPWLLDIMGHVDTTGELQIGFQHPGRTSAHVERLAGCFREQLLAINALCGATTQPRAVVTGPRREVRPAILARAALPGDYEDVSSICAATFSTKSAWVARRLGPATWLDPIWESDDTAKLVLEVGGRVVGYLIGALDLESFDFRGLRRISLKAPWLIAEALHEWARGGIRRSELVELVRQLDNYRQYTCWHARCEMRAWLDGTVRPKNINFHFNILAEHASSGGMLALIGMWEEWLRARGEPYAYLHASTFHGLEGDRNLQNELAEGLGYRYDSELSALYWIKELGGPALVV